MITQTIYNCKYCLAENCIITNYSSGEIVCTNCGIVHEERIIDEEYESRNFIDENGQNKSRIGAPINIHYEDKLSTGLVLKNKKDNYLTIKREKISPIRKVFSRAEELGAKLQIKSIIIELSKDTLHKLLKANVLRKKLLDHIIIIVFFTKFLQEGIERSLSDMRCILGLNKDEMKRAYTLISQHLTEKSNPLKQLKLNLDLFVTKMKIDNEDKILIDQIAENVVQNNILSELSSATLAATVIYLYSKLFKKDNVTLLTIQTMTNIKKDQIKSAYLVFIQHKQIIPNEWKEHIDNLNNVDVV